MNKRGSIMILVLAEAAGMIPWFTTAAVLPDMVGESGISEGAQALLSSSVQAGFVIGALLIAFTQLADRIDPRRLFCGCAVAASLANAFLVLVPVGGMGAIALRLITGALLAGVYPIGMKIAIGWGTADRGLLVGLLVGALTFGKSAPYFLAFVGGADWKLAVLSSSVIAATGGVAVLAVSLGPGHATASAFNPKAIMLAWTDRRIRSAYLGYFGHMWELFAIWAWVATASASSYQQNLDTSSAESLGKLTGFLMIALGAPFCVVAGHFADRIGKAEITIIAMAFSGTAAIATAATFGGPVWLTMTLIIIWGIAVIPDSAQFSALVADYSPPALAGSLLTLQTAIGFTLTIFTVQLMPVAASILGWPLALGLLAIGPLLGIIAMRPLRRARTGYVAE